ncbi:MAG: hypothetical protein JOZ69_01025, partial [Myxococcales bacterium]|nr:hypothetical protein [Myxococcales bacterium]
MRVNGRRFPLLLSAGWALVAGCGTSAGHAGFGTDGGGDDASVGTGSGGPGGGPGSSSSGSSGSGAPGGGTSSGVDSGGTTGAASSGGAGSSGGGTSSGSGGPARTDAGAPGGGADGGVPAGDGGACTIGASNVRVAEIDVGAAIAYNEIDANGAQPGLEPLAIAPIPSGGSRLSWMGSDGMLHVARLDANDQLVTGTAFTMAAFDYEDLWADDTGGVALVTRPALGGSAADHNCGNINNLCGLVANYPTADPCMDMYLVRFDGTSETWSAKLTDTSATLPAYDTSPTSTTNVVFIWWYAHNGRIAFDGANYGAYFGAAISTSQACVGQSTMTTGINIHQGDRLKVVTTSGVVQSGGFSFGCSHSAFERLIWDPNAKAFVSICENDAPTGGKSGRIAIAPRTTTIYAADLSYSNLGSLLADPAGGYWAITSDIRAGQPAGMDGLADVLL